MSSLAQIPSVVQFAFSKSQQKRNETQQETTYECTLRFKLTLELGRSSPFEPKQANDPQQAVVHLGHQVVDQIKNRNILSQAAFEYSSPALFENPPAASPDVLLERPVLRSTQDEATLCDGSEPNDRPGKRPNYHPPSPASTNAHEAAETDSTVNGRRAIEFHQAEGILGPQDQDRPGDIQDNFQGRGRGGGQVRGRGSGRGRGRGRGRGSGRGRGRGRSRADSRGYGQGSGRIQDGEQDASVLGKRGCGSDEHASDLQSPSDVPDLEPTTKRLRNDVTKYTMMTCDQLVGAVIGMIEEGLKNLKIPGMETLKEMQCLCVESDNAYAQLSMNLDAVSKKLNGSSWPIWLISVGSACCAFEDMNQGNYTTTGRNLSKTSFLRYRKMFSFIGRVVQEFHALWHSEVRSLMLINVLGASNTHIRLDTLTLLNNTELQSAAAQVAESLHDSELKSIPILWPIDPTKTIAALAGKSYDDVQAKLKFPVSIPSYPTQAEEVLSYLDHVYGGIKMCSADIIRSQAVSSPLDRFTPPPLSPPGDGLNMPYGWDDGVSWIEEFFD